MLKQDQLDEIERIETRNKRIQELLAANEGETAPVVDEDAPNWEPSTEEPKAEPKAESHYAGRPLYPWEKLVRGRPEQFRPMTSREISAMDEAAMMQNIRRQDEAFERKVQAAIRERDAEQRDIDKRRQHEEKTGRRPYGEKRFISLDQARREGYLKSENENNGMPEWWSPDNPTGMFAGGRR